ncbi:WYL domain-containing protein [Clostridium tyrobutyricum]|jgi:predicted DNA-binding transcriptional regulator YafY|uniref:Transcriptional regulator, DeoR family n=1 Tax=Clostridium tyrobutyricum DIVETGP TaxID=1408889 RepID=W6N4E7_CLOTY|nr:YafY family protein [Clostridium tyrobutyricum]AND84923.1 transcriptional regulator [Clostridium tyrobutyricum]ANP69493.1 decarboxylase [Clostridium tyrobutyricum]MBV4426598.1 YafY family transcriptional regulator [Clostridium tyrobutyricum]MBV4431037.1 YafY family transcriptional regulator [Clostridium tyrobutyricum]MBV4434857.1 YafY family transcriptional regulator [Clostridium tyrobutyricum]
MKINRLLAIVVMLLNKDKISAAELAEKFEVSIRTIYRDIGAIDMSGIPIASRQGNNGGFYILDNYKINHQFLTLNDMISIVEALKNINGVLDDRNVEIAMEKVKSIIPYNKKSAVDLYFKQVFVDTLPWGFKKSEKENVKYKIVYEAVKENKCISFNYRNSKGEYILRNAEPITLVFKGFSWYVFSFCMLRKDYRTFKLTRMDELKILNKDVCKYRISYEEYIKTYNSKKVVPVKISLKFSEKARYRIQDYFDEEETTFLKDGSVVVNTEIVEDNWIYSVILSYGEYVEVLEPEHIRKIIGEKSKKTSDIYK